MSDLTDRREFLLRSLEDLEREHAAGDMDEADYLALRADYTARAAAALRSEPGEVPPPRPRRSRRVLVVAGVALFAVVAGLLVAQASGRRDPGDTITGGINQSVTEKLNEALRRFQEGDADGALGLYDEVLASQPANVEALTYKGWTQYALLGDADTALLTLIDAATTDPAYPDAHAFLAVVFFRSGLLEQAGRELDRLDALDPPPALLEQISGLREEIEAAIALQGATTTTR